MEAVFEETALEIGVQIAVPEIRGEIGGAGADRGLGTLRILVNGGVVPTFHGGHVTRIAEAGEDDVVGEGFPTLGGGVGGVAGVAVVEILIRGVVARGEGAVADAGDHAVLHDPRVEGGVDFGFPRRADGAGRVRDIVGADVEDLGLGGAAGGAEHGEETGIGADAQGDGGVVGVAQRDIEGAVADVDVLGAVAAPPLEVIGETVVEAVRADVGALFAESVGAFEAEVALVGHGEDARGAGAAVDERAVGDAAGGERIVGEEEIADVVAGVVAGLEGGEEGSLGAEFEGERGVQVKRVSLVIHGVAFAFGIGERDGETDRALGGDGAGPKEFEAAETVGADGGAGAGDGTGTGGDAGDVDDAASAALTVECATGALDDIGAADRDRVDGHEAAEAVFVGGGGDAADEEGIVFGVILSAAGAAGGSVELDTGDVFEGVAKIEGADVAHERGREHLDVHGKIFDGRVVTRAGGGVGGAVFVVALGGDLEDVEFDDLLGAGAGGGARCGGGDLGWEGWRGSEQRNEGRQEETVRFHGWSGGRKRGERKGKTEDKLQETVR